VAVFFLLKFQNWLVLPFLYQVSFRNIMFMVFVSCEVEILLNPSVTVIVLAEAVDRDSNSPDFHLNFGSRISARLLASQVTNSDWVSDSDKTSTYFYKASRSALVPTELHFQWLLLNHSSGGGADRSDHPLPR
jgi:hypothetical protein